MSKYNGVFYKTKDMVLPFNFEVIFKYTTNDVISYKFNDEHFPKLNVLYVHLIGGEYYTDDIYIKENRKRKRHIIFISGKIRC